MSEASYVRVQHHSTDGSLGLTCYYQVDRDGYVPREVFFDPSGAPTYITRDGEYPTADYPAPMGSEAFESQFGNGERITAEEFEAAFVLADAALP